LRLSLSLIAVSVAARHGAPLGAIGDELTLRGYMTMKECDVWCDGLDFDSSNYFLGTMQTMHRASLVAPVTTGMIFVKIFAFKSKLILLWMQRVYLHRPFLISVAFLPGLLRLMIYLLTVRLSWRRQPTMDITDVIPTHYFELK